MYCLMFCVVFEKGFCVEYPLSVKSGPSFIVIQNKDDLLEFLTRIKSEIQQSESAEPLLIHLQDLSSVLDFIPNTDDVKDLIDQVMDLFEQQNLGEVINKKEIFIPMIERIIGGIFTNESLELTIDGEEESFVKVSDEEPCDNSKNSDGFSQ